MAIVNDSTPDSPALGAVIGDHSGGAMTVLRRNMLANMAGTGWLAIVQLLVTPIYAGLLGVEQFALIGLYLVLQTALRVLELGLSPAINRELARYSTQPARADEARDFGRTCEVLYLLLGFTVGAVLWLAAPMVANRWLEPRTLDTPALVGALRLMGVLAGLQWPIYFYQGGLQGLERQRTLNAAKGAMATLLALAGVTLLSIGGRSISGFFWSQIVVTVCYVAIIRTLLWRKMPTGSRAPRITPSLLRNTRRFAAGVSAISICSLILSQADKFVLSNLLSLEDFGYYSMVSILAGGLAVIYAPMFNAILPRFSALVASGRSSEVRGLFERASQGIAILTVPTAIVIALFPSELLLLWSADSHMATLAAPWLALLLVGNTLNGMMSLPYALQLANGWTSLALSLNLAFVAVQIPALLLAVPAFGPIGAPLVWVGLNTAYVLIGIPATHRRLLGSSGGVWFRDLARAAMPALAVSLALRYLLSGSLSTVLTALVLAGTLLMAVGAALAANPVVLREIQVFAKSRGRRSSSAPHA